MPLKEALPRAGAGAASGRQEQQRGMGTKVQIWRVMPEQGHRNGAAACCTGLGPSTTLVVPYRPQPGPTLHLRSSKYQTGDSVWLAQPHWWDTSVFLLAGHFSPVVLAGGAALSLSPSASQPTLFSLMSLQCPLSQAAQPSTPFARTGVLVVWWILLFVFVALLCFLRVTCFLVSIHYTWKFLHVTFTPLFSVHFRLQALWPGNVSYSINGVSETIKKKHLSGPIVPKGKPEF